MTTDVTVERIQNRRGLKINLPQPLRPGEYGFCTDTYQLFLGMDPEYQTPAIQAYNGQYQYVQDRMDQQILVAYYDVAIDPSEIPDIIVWLNSQIPTIPAIGSALGKIFHVEDTGTLYFGADVAQISALQTYVNTVTHPVTNNLIFRTDVGYESYIGLNKTVDVNGGVIFDFHSESNAVGAILNLIAEDEGTGACATTKLNMEILTEYTNLNPFDQLLEPLEIVLPISADPVYTNIDPELRFEVEQSDIIDVDYSLHYDNTPDTYIANGKFTIAANIHEKTAVLNDERTELPSGAWPGYYANFVATYIDNSATPGMSDEVVISQSNNMPSTGTAELQLNVMTRRWVSF